MKYKEYRKKWKQVYEIGKFLKWYKEKRTCKDKKINK